MEFYAFFIKQNSRVLCFRRRLYNYGKFGIFSIILECNRTLISNVMEMVGGIF